VEQLPRTIDSPSGSWAEGAVTVPRRDRAYDLTTQESLGFIQKNSNPQGRGLDYPVAPNDGMWKAAANSGSYTFFDNVQAEGVFYIDHDSYNVILFLLIEKGAKFQLKRVPVIDA